MLHIMSLLECSTILLRVYLFVIERNLYYIRSCTHQLKIINEVNPFSSLSFYRRIVSVLIIQRIYLVLTHDYYILAIEKLRSIYLVYVKVQTKNKVIQASVWHEFVDQQLFVLLNRTTKKFYKITVLKCCHQLYFIFELLSSLSRCFR